MAPEFNFSEIKGRSALAESAQHGSAKKFIAIAYPGQAEFGRCRFSAGPAKLEFIAASRYSFGNFDPSAPDEITTRNLCPGCQLPPTSRDK
jgi:hypothetical protein